MVAVVPTCLIIVCRIPKDRIVAAAPVGMVTLDRDVGAMVEQAIQDMRRFAGPG
jgi:hypothetical protein